MPHSLNADMTIDIRPAKPDEAPIVADVLGEAARWLDETGRRLWREEHVSQRSIEPDVIAGHFVIAWQGERAVGVIKATLDDELFWPDVPKGEGIYLHRLAVRREAAGQGVSNALLQWAVDKARSLGRPYVRLDCVAERPRLRAVYERFGFEYVSDWPIENFIVARYQYRV